MHVTVKWFEGKYPSFNVNVASAEGKEDFLSIRGCRIANGANGEFLSMPSTKNESTGKYWNHAWVSDAFANHILNIAKKTQPQSSAASNKPNAKPSFDDDAPW